MLYLGFVTGIFAGAHFARLEGLNADRFTVAAVVLVDKHPDSVGDLKGTGEQAQRICLALGLSPEESAKVLAPFKLLY